MQSAANARCAMTLLHRLMEIAGCLEKRSRHAIVTVAVAALLMVFSSLSGEPSRKPWAVDTNLLVNGGFEADEKNPVGWALMGGDTGSHVENGTSMEGRRCYMLKGIEKGWVALSQRVGEGLVAELPPLFRLSAWIKTDGMKGGMGTCAGELSLWFSAEDGKNAGAIPLAEIFQFTEWTHYEKTFRSKDIEKFTNAKYWTVRANLCDQPGTMWIDDVQFKVVEPPMVSLNLESTDLFLNAGGVAAKTSLSQNALEKGASLSLEIIDRDAKPMAGKSQQRSVKLTESDLWRMPVDGLTEGSWRLRARLLDTAGEVVGEDVKSFALWKGPFDSVEGEKWDWRFKFWGIFN